MNNIIEAIEAKLQAQKDEIFFKNIQIEDLKQKLEEAEKEIADLKITVNAVNYFIEKGEAK